MGFNAEGQIKNDNKDAYIRELENKLKEMQKPKRRQLKKWDFSNILPKVSEKDLPWM